MGGKGTIRLGSTALDAARTPPPLGPRPGVLEPGALLDGRYRILELLGTGGMGSVYRAEHEAIGRVVAVKVLHPEHGASAAERERFRREARVAVRLRSPHVVETLDFGEDPEGRLFLVMELLEGQPVRAVLAREGRLAPERVVRLLRQLLAGLEAAHTAGIVHRDLKPENLWLDGSGLGERLRLLDFGIAKWTGIASGTAQTQAGLVVGTPEYLAPEQAVGGEVDHRSDLYSTGILAFVLLTGRHPFDTRDVRALLAAHAYRAVPSPSSLVPELTAYPRLLETVARATEKERERRPGSARELIQALEGAEFPVRLSRGSSTGTRTAAAPPLTEARASLLGIPAARIPDVLNLTLVQVNVAGWESWSPATSPAFRARHLAAHDARVLPVVRAFGGRRVEADQGASVFAFRSPTDAVHCAAALQDAAADGLRFRDEVGRLELQIGVHQGEIHLDRRGATGAPLATARSLAEGAAAREVWLTRSVYLTMSRSEAPAEEMGPRALAGLAEPVPTYRLVRGPGPEPYGNRHGGVPRPRPAGAMAGMAVALASVQIAGETEGRIRALGRVLWSAAILLAVRIPERGAGGLHALVYRLHRALTHAARRPWALQQLLAVLERARRLFAVHEPGLVLACRRPVRRG
jgi:class 3 adenylate cyclase/tRNA A-37 threonylcarbamoyl transferase component Bud32